MAKLSWDVEAKAALGRVPFFVRPLARRKVEERARQSGAARVTLAHLQEAEARFRSVLGGKSQAELQSMMPQPNQPGARLLVVEACHHELSGCPNVLLHTAPWREALEAWARDSDISERLRRRVKGDRILHYHKLRVAIAGCPNACSRPQIADVGIVGFVRPRVDPDGCTVCGACAEVCPDKAIIVEGAPPRFDREACQGCLRCSEACPKDCILLSEPRARVLVGGKLGRHPHLAEPFQDVGVPEDLVAMLDELVGDYLDRAAPRERFASFCVRTRAKGKTS